MPLVAAKCTQCGASIEVDDTKEAGICKYCGTAFVTEKAINNYNVTNNISAQTVNIIEVSATNDFETEGHRLIVYKGTAEIVEVPGYIDTICYGAFKDNNYIKKIILSNIMLIEDNAFSRCKNLSEIVFGPKGAIIHAGAFCECTSLKEIKFPEGIPYIMPQAFSGCSSLESVEIPSSVSWIGELAFSGCSSLKYVNFHSNTTRIYQNTFLGCTSLNCTDMSNRYISKESNNTAKNGCYIATCVYGSYDCPQVWTLRRFRDYTLDETWHGRLFIKCYYAISPTLVKWFGKTKWFKRFWKSRLDKMVANLNSKGIEDINYKDKY
ncbi:MAG: leucine-rich repeat domain-containing protein [Lachnospiraceae bacterium]|nr:leucine-rich repeat domain-containing protein [Lachnospiraceae bacterium]